MSKILVLTGDVLGRRLAGPAIRAIEIARYLSRNHEVILGCPVSEAYSPDFPVTVEEFGNEPGKSMLESCDIAIVPGSLIISEHIPCPLIVDLYDPFILSNLTRFTAEPESATALFNAEFNVLVRKLYTGDFFLCASEKQWNFWIGMLAAFRRINQEQYQRDHHLQALLAIVPFGIPDSLPAVATKTYLPAAPKDTKWIIWGGGIWNWFDPLTLIHAMKIVEKTDPSIRLFFMGTQHPNPKMKEMEMSIRAKKLARKLKLIDSNVFFGDWVPYDDRGSCLKQAHLGISIHSPHIETQFSFRTRILDYIWAELPIISTQGDAMAELIHTKNLGVTVAPSDCQGLADAILELIHNREHYQTCKTNVSNASVDFKWSRVLEPLGSFCNSPRFAPDHESTFRIDSDDQELFCYGCEARKSPFGELVKGVVIKQRFKATHHAVCRIDLSLATYARTITGTASFRLRDVEKSVDIMQIPINLCELLDNDWKAIRFDPILDSKEREYEICLEASESTYGNAITIWTDPEEVGQYTANDTVYPGSIGFRYFYRPEQFKPRPLSIWRRFFRMIRVLQ